MIKQISSWTFAPLILILVIGVLAIATSSPGYAAQSVRRHSGLGRTAPFSPGACDQGPFNLPGTRRYDLDEVAGDWGAFCEGTPTWIITNVTTPTLDTQSLRCSITGGNPYSNVHCYRVFLADPYVTVFTLSLSFYFTPTTTFNTITSTVQALEFTMNKWHQSQRYEFALQWQNVGTGAPQWRYWDPNQPTEKWVSTGITGTLAGEQWHTFVMEGEIIGGQVYYRKFIIDAQEHLLGITVSPFPAPSEPDRLAIAVQLDGNSEEKPYDVFIDKVTFWRLPNFGFFPTISK